MHNIIKNTIYFTLVILITGCSDAFLNENIEKVSVPVCNSNLYISPQWDSSDYTFGLTGLGSEEYTIVSKPSWLNIEPMNGHFLNGSAVVNCSVSEFDEYKATGIYLENMTIKVSGTEYKVPVAYISEGNPKIQVANSMSIQNDHSSLQIKNTGSGILIWDVVSMPDWLAIDTTSLTLNGLFLEEYTSYNIPLKIQPNQNSIGLLNGTIVLSTNDKQRPEVSISVSIYFGTPSLNIYTNDINFGTTEISKFLTFGNYGDGILSWKFENLPAWLTVSPSSGSFSTYNSAYIDFQCDRSKLEPGQNTATVKLITNDPQRPTYDITVSALAPGNKDNIRLIEGNIIDVMFNKADNKLYYVTSQPNKFIICDIATKSVTTEIALSKAPTSFDITEDWTKAAIGHNGSLSIINLSNHTISNTYDLSYSVYDVAWAENDWFALTQNGGSFTKIHWINTATGETYEAERDDLDGKSKIKKVPGQPYLIGTRNSTSPSGFFAFDISTKSKKSYSHMDLTNFWLSEDGQYIFAQNSNVYRTSSSTGSSDTFNTEINAIGKLNFDDGSTYGVSWVTHSNNSLWVLRSSSYSANNCVYKLDDNDYFLQKKYYFDTQYQNDQSEMISLQAYYVYTNNAETQIMVLSKETTNNNWVIQYIPITE